MEQIVQAVTWLQAHWAAILSTLTTVVTVASVLAKLTPSQSDNRVVDGVAAILHALALNPKADQARPVISDPLDADKK